MQHGSWLSVPTALCRVPGKAALIVASLASQLAICKFAPMSKQLGLGYYTAWDMVCSWHINGGLWFHQPSRGPPAPGHVLPTGASGQWQLKTEMPPYAGLLYSTGRCIGFGAGLLWCWRVIRRPLPRAALRATPRPHSALLLFTSSYMGAFL